MKYKIILEAELENMKDVAAVLMEVSARLSGDNMKVALLEVCGAPSSSSAGGAPTCGEVEAYFGTLVLPRGVSARDEALKFYSYNKAAGWKYAAAWQKLARDWVARIRVDDAASSFVVDEFFAAALENSMKQTGV